MTSAAHSRRPSTLAGLIGAGIGASRTPAMHEAEARRLGHSLVYKTLDTERMGPTPPSLKELLDHARLFGFSGLNITYPFKQAVVPLLDDLSDVSRALNAVNTVVIRGERLAGYNTDYWGFRESFQSEMRGELRNHVLLLGAGGAGSAVAQALMDVGVGCLHVSDTDQAVRDALVARLVDQFGSDRVIAVDDVEAAAAGAEGIVNASPVGMAKLPGTPMPVDWLQPRHWVVDIIYFPMETAFLKAAREKGCTCANGSGMAILQAARAFEHFTGLDPDPKKMRETFNAFG